MQGSSKTTKATSCALAGKTARACESCLKRRARWFCASDDAFLCHACDTSVHLANKLSSRHKRVRLETHNPPSVANPNFNSSSSSLSPSTLPAWQGGFTRKARTPRNGSRPTSKKSTNNLRNNLVVPEIGSDNEGDEDLCGSFKIKEDDQLIFSVPVFDPFEISSGPDHQNEFSENSKLFGGGSRSDKLDFESEFGISLVGFDHGCDQLVKDVVVDDDDDENNWNKMRGFLPSDAELAEFAADVETLLIDDDEEGRMKGIMPLLDDDHHKVEIESVYGESYGMMKVEDDTLGESVNMAAISSCWGLDFSMKCEDEKVVVVEEERPMRWVDGGGCGGGGKGSEIDNKRKKICLRLNYDEVINEWASQGSPWTSGCRPEFDVIDGWPNCMGVLGPTGVQSQIGEGGHVDGGDGGRVARVMRYREKRKSRLFSKKIRYEVRKLNAEKRPRLKGRFVKRTNSSSYTSSSSIGVKPTFNYLKV